MHGPERRQHESYEEWKAWALSEDERTGASLWKETDQTRLYDHQVIRRRYDELSEIRRSGDAKRLLYYLNEGLHGNMGGMGSPALYARARFGTKRLINDYIDELVLALHDFEALPSTAIDPSEKRAVLARTRVCFGRSALMLSGAGSLGAFHLGVVKALAEQHLIPTVVSGASAGAIVAGIVGSHPAADLPRLLSRELAVSLFDPLRGPDARPGTRTRLRTENLRALIEGAIPDVTFIEAFEETGRHINVSVAPASLHQRSRLLNAITSPNAFIREAVMASCAIPGLFPAVTLAARDSSGERRPYVPSRQWVDGSITDDLPARRLARLHGINHFISSQANPIVLWASQDPHAPDTLSSRLAGISLSASQDWLRATYPFTMKLLRDRHRLSIYARFCFGVLTQDYRADVNIVPRRRLFDPRMLLAALPAEENDALIAEGEEATWPKIEIIRNCTEVSRCVDGLLARIDRGPARDEAVLGRSGGTPRIGLVT